MMFFLYTEMKNKVKERFSKEQWQEMEAVYKRNAYPNSDTVTRLAERFDFERKKIMRWFINRRKERILRGD